MLNLSCLEQLTKASGRKYDLDESMFERLALSGSFPVVCLKEQRRMRPSIADVIRLEIYPDLRDHPSLEHYPPVSGMRSNVFFMNHSEPEDAVKGGIMDDNVSKSNRSGAVFL